MISSAYVKARRQLMKAYNRATVRYHECQGADYRIPLQVVLSETNDRDGAPMLEFKLVYPEAAVALSFYVSDNDGCLAADYGRVAKAMYALRTTMHDSFQENRR